jgi:DNA-directed RNA polymerase subunit M/transcription elongation factor TFIIS
VSSTSALHRPFVDHALPYPSEFQPSTSQVTSPSSLSPPSHNSAWRQQVMDSGGHISSVQRSSEQQNSGFQIAQGGRDNTRQESLQDTTASAPTNTSSNRNIPAFANQPQGYSVAITSTKGLPEANRPEFSIPPLPANLPTRRKPDTPDDRVTRNPAYQPVSYPMSLPQEAPTEYKTQHERPEGEEGPPPQRRRLTSPDRETGRVRSEEEADPQKASGANKPGSLSYDPVHENVRTSTPQHETGHSRRPSSANSHRSQLSSYSGQSSNQDPEGSSPLTGDPSSSRDGKKRKHKCQECGQYFTRLHNLKSHLLTHSQEKPFICDQCGHKFRRLHDLKRRFQL